MRSLAVDLVVIGKHTQMIELVGELLLMLMMMMTMIGHVELVLLLLLLQRQLFETRCCC